MYSFLSSVKQPKAPFLASNGLLLLMGKWRLYWNYCPECNSNAPKLHHCEVCNADTKSLYNWNKEVEARWWSKFIEKHHNTSIKNRTVGVG